MSATEQVSTIKSTKGLVTSIVIGVAAPVIVGSLLFTQFWPTGQGVSGDNASTPEAIAERIKPVARLAVGAKQMSNVQIQGGKPLYDASCGACHNAGAAGAPKLGDKGDWAARSRIGIEALLASAIAGKGSMPAKGGATGASDADLKATIQYMLDALK